MRRNSPKQGYAYHVPYRSILPRPEQCDNLLVPVALSCTHVGISSLRIEGAWMIIGQGAGIAAALAVDQNVAVQELDYALLRKRLLAQKQVLELPVICERPEASGVIPANSLPGIDSTMPQGHTHKKKSALVSVVAPRSCICVGHLRTYLLEQFDPRKPDSILDRRLSCLF